MYIPATKKYNHHHHYYSQQPVGNVLKANLHAKGNGYNKTSKFMVKQEFGNVSCPLKVSANMERALNKKKY